jgi:hypothetical protein
MNQERSCRFDSRVGWAIALGTLAVGAGMGCEPSKSVKAGAAVMLSFGAVDAMAPLDPYAAPAYLAPDAAGTLVIPPRSEFIAIFDRLLDPDLLEDPATGALPGLAAVTPPVAGVPVDLSTTYSPGGDSMFHVFLPAGPSFTVNPTCGLPSGAAGTVQLQMAQFVSHDGTTPVALGTGVTSAIAYQTQPLAVTIGVPPGIPDPLGGPDVLGTATPDTAITLSFSNLTPPGTSPMPDAVPPPPPPCTYYPALGSLAPNIHVVASVNGAAPAPVAAVISQNPMDATQWVVAPPGTGADGTGGAWPDGATVTISVDSGAVDIFNQPLGPTEPASFTVAAAAAGGTP